MPTGRAAILLDRDGTLIEDVGYPRDPDRVHLLTGVAPALRALQTRGSLLVVVSNQSGIGRGLITTDEAQSVVDRFEEMLEAEGIRLDGSYSCPRTPEDRYPCRKPAPGMLLRAAADLEISLDHSFLVGGQTQ